MEVCKKGKGRGGRYHNQIFLLLLLISTIPLLIVGFVSYTIYTDEMTKQTDLSMEAIKIQVSNDVENVLSTMRQYYIENSEANEIKWLRDTGSIPYSQYSNLYDAQKLLNGPIYFSAYVGNYAFINIKQGWILTNRGMYRLDEVRNQEQVDAFLNYVDESSSTLYWENNMGEPTVLADGPYRSNSLDISGMQLVMKLPGLSAANMDQVLLVQLNMTALSQQLNKSLAGYELCIMSQDGRQWFSSNEVLSDYLNSEKFALGGSSQISTVKVAGGQSYRLMVSTISSNGMRYVIAYNLSNIRKSAGKIFVFSLMVVISLLLVIIICWVFTSILYKPLKSLTTYVSEAVDNQEEKRDEFTFIKENMVQLIDTKDNLQLMVKEQHELLVEQFLIRAIRGELTVEAVNNAQERFRLNTAKEYRLMAVICMLEKESNQESELENEALSLTIINAIPEDLNGFLIVPPFNYNEQIMILIGAESIEELQDKTGNIHKKLTEFIGETFSCSIISGVSQVFHRLKYLRIAYNECAETLRNASNLDHKQSDITYFEDIAGRDSIDGYDFVAENSLTKAINGGDGEEADQIVDKFVNSLYNRGITSHNRSFYIYRMVTSVLSVLSDAGLSMNQVFSGETEDIFLQLNHIYEKDSLKSYISHKIIRPSVEALKQYRFNASSDILRKITESVHESKGDITLAECAEQLNYHPSYIWKVLKAERNKTFTDLVTMEKLDEAKKMLTQSELSVTEIAEALKYSNTQNFIRFFSKYEQVTPGKYRKIHQTVE